MKPRVLFGFFVFAAIVTAAAPLVGGRMLSPMVLFQAAGQSLDAEIFWKIRIPRTVVALLAGAALSVAGLAFQAIFRNALATPFTLGISSGASFGATLFVRLGASAASLFGFGISAAAFAGALVSMSVVYGLTRVRRGISMGTLLLAGVAVSFCFSSAILFIHYTATLAQSFKIVRWMMGGIDVVGLQAIWQLAPFVAVGVAALAFVAGDLNLLASGSDIAAGRGVDVRRVRAIVFFTVSVMVAGVVSVCGPIGFIGLMAPHICRVFLGWDHRYLLPAAVVFGGAFLVLCDTVARTIVAPIEVPVGVLTSMLGGPFFLWLLISEGARVAGDEE